MDTTHTTAAQIKNINHQKIYQLLYSAPEGLTKQGIVRELNLSLPTVTQKLNELHRQGLIWENGTVGNTGGRKAATFSAVADAKMAVGVEIDKFYFTIVLADLYGRIVRCWRREQPFKRETAYYQIVGEQIQALIRSAGIPAEKILGVGFGLPGLATPDGQRIFYGKILDFEGLGCQEFSSFLPYPCHFYNDAKAAGFAELWDRADVKNAFYILLSHHVGGAMIYGHAVDLGEHTCAGEVGHMALVPGGRPCYCGRLGCVDPYCAATVLTEWSGGNLGLFFQELSDGQENHVKAWEAYCEYLSLAANNVHMLMDCPVILGGEVGAYLGPYLDKLNNMARACNPFTGHGEYLLACQCQTEAIALGAALPFVDDFLKHI